MKLNEFLAEAKIKTYASNVEEVKLPNGDRKLSFKKADYSYEDIYQGYRKFAGKEKVFKKNKLIWTMSYKGGIKLTVFSAKKIYLFLKDALKKVPKDIPFRGPKNFKQGDFEYKNTIRGSIKKFKGSEKIIHNGKEVYGLEYSGGKN